MNNFVGDYENNEADLIENYWSYFPVDSGKVYWNGLEN